jgi:hypothetical protein
MQTISKQSKLGPSLQGKYTNIIFYSKERTQITIESLSLILREEYNTTVTPSGILKTEYKLQVLDKKEPVSILF